MKWKDSFGMRHKFAIVAGGFVVYFCLFDDHSVLQYFIYQRQQAALEREIAVYRDSLAHYEAFIQELDEGGESMEYYARERLLMKRTNEDIYIVK